jgi:DNA-binding SARP family transcriptional activator
VTIEFGVLGPLQVSRDGDVVVLEARMWRRLLAVLLCRFGQSVSVATLIDELWNGAPPQSARKTAQVYVRRLRQAIGDERIVYGAAGYAVVAAPQEVDALRFAEMVVRGRAARARADLESAAELFGQALGLWRGSAYADVDEVQLVADEVRRLEEQRLLAYEELVAVNLDLGRDAEMAGELAGTVPLHPYRERLHGYLMLALYRAGRQAEALEVYRRAHAALTGELGVEPGALLKRIHQAVLHDDERFRRITGESRARLAGDSIDQISTDGAVRQHPGEPLARRPAADRSGGPEGPGGDNDSSAVLQPVVPSPCLLPADIVDFTGRDEQVERLSHLLTADMSSTALPIVAVVGRAGVGKTTLAVHVAHRLREAFPDGQLFVDLHGMEAQSADPARVLARFLIALGVDGRGLPKEPEERAEMFRAVLADRRMLVVLDNAASERQVQHLLPGSPSCAVIVTSQRRLAGLSAHSLYLDGLDLESALALLGRIAGPERLAGEPALAAEIVGLCGQLPLAVRIAGARLAARDHWTLAHLAARLRGERRRLDELAAGDLTVRASLAMSYGALSAGTRRAFRLLGLLDVPDFAGWVLAALLDAGVVEIESHIDELIDAQLLVHDGIDACGQFRYRFHDLARLYARERAHAEETSDQRAQALTRALGAWLALADAADEGLAERVASDIRGSAPRWYLDPAMIRMLVADPLAWFDSERGQLATGVSQACRAGLDELAWELSARAITYYAFRGLYEDWAQTHELALRTCAHNANRRGEAVMSRNLGCLRMTGVKAASGVVLANAESALTTFQELGERHGEVDALGFCAYALRHRGEFDQALAVAEAAMAAAKDLEYKLGQCRLWYLHAVISREQGRYEDAILHAWRCLHLTDHVGTSHDRVLALWELAAVCNDLDTFHSASRHLREGIESCRRRGASLLEAYLALAQGALYIRFGRSGARELIQVALDAFDKHAVLFGQTVGLRLLGQLDHAAGRLDDALGNLTKAVRTVRNLRNTYEQAVTLKAHADAQHAYGDHDAARRAWREAHHLFERINNVTEAVKVKRLLETPGA